jgi:hypothetical protein
MAGLTVGDFPALGTMSQGWNFRDAPETWLMTIHGNRNSTLMSVCTARRENLGTEASNR